MRKVLAITALTLAGSFGATADTTDQGRLGSRAPVRADVRRRHRHFPLQLGW
jgi:hypothetical protein